MSNADKLLEVLRLTKGVLCDDCLSQQAHIYPRQQVNAIATRLANTHRISRTDSVACICCRRIKKGSTIEAQTFLTLAQAQPETRRVTEDENQTPISPKQEFKEPVDGYLGSLNKHRPWHWEGNVQIALRDYMLRDGWSITHFADTERKQSGIDLGATKGSRAILFEVKGYPTTVYDYGPKHGLSKPTQPSSQARQWYSHAMLGIMKLREKFPSKEIALCFPDFETYRRLIEGTRSSLQLLGIAVYLVKADHSVSIHLSANGPTDSSCHQSTISTTFSGHK